MLLYGCQPPQRGQPSGTVSCGPLGGGGGRYPIGAGGAGGRGGGGGGVLGKPRVQFSVLLHSDWAELAVELGVKNTPTPVAAAGLTPAARLAASTAAAINGSTTTSTTLASPPTCALAFVPTKLDKTITGVNNLRNVRIICSQMANRCGSDRSCLCDALSKRKNHRYASGGQWRLI